MNFRMMLESEEELWNSVEIIKKKCKPYIQEMRRIRAKHFFYRGSVHTFSDFIKEIKPRKNRQPKDMIIELQELLDEKFNKKFGWRPRSEGVFATYSDRTATEYGSETYIFFPVGKYKYLYSPEVDDLYTETETEDILDYASGDIRVYEWQWESEYGEGSQGGTWYYEEEDTGETDKYDAIDVAAEAEGIEPNEISMRKLKWVPEVSFEEWVELEEQRIRDRADERLDEIIHSYTDKNLKGVLMAPSHEVMWKCRSYILFSIYGNNRNDIEWQINKYLLGSKDPFKIDTRQIELPLKFK